MNIRSPKASLLEPACAGFFLFAFNLKKTWFNKLEPFFFWLTALEPASLLNSSCVTHWQWGPKVISVLLSWGSRISSFTPRTQAGVPSISGKCVKKLVKTSDCSLAAKPYSGWAREALSQGGQGKALWAICFGNVINLSCRKHLLLSHQTQWLTLFQGSLPSNNIQIHFFMFSNHHAYVAVQWSQESP